MDTQHYQEPCGCVPHKYGIDYCPTHAASSEMLALLRENPVHAHEKAWWNDRRRALLAKIEGQSCPR